jgi:hypothetical protein
MRLMKRIRESIKNDTFPTFVKKFIRNYYSNQTKDMKLNKRIGEDQQQPSTSVDSANKFNIPEWVVNSLNAVNINVLED